ncbi:CRISPR-associated RAMP protein [Ktedonosporobacter rubrisoli]|uniref:CRISPR-associated RAMP protein n=1 Tax=Ktedonosporobacter rubrisoli TaxID=2509675 RepID=A0A4P6JTL2_KTERU|nr:CRISPR-associated RAMP protein Csx7 [Ktedonosporobacter rubrisoli]QBD78665.1 CRISPR-associated RAMP protein [Ktedonosporobacter rubrisoli]
MLKKLVNEAYFTLRITTTGPLLVRSGQATISGPDMTPVLTFRNGRSEIFLPGSSLKGVFRSHSEKIVCSLKPRVVCYPFSGNEDKIVDLAQHDYRVSCGEMFTRLVKPEGGEERNLEQNTLRAALEARTDLAYAYSCPTCRLFGSTGFIGRIAISDAYLASGSFTEQRDGVGIDRLTGGASHGAKFELEVVSTGVIFETDIHLRNFEIWQLGMLFVILQDLEDELIHIGSGRSRGLGKVVAQISPQGRNGRPGGFVISTIRGSREASKMPANEVWGLGRWLNDGSYGTQSDDSLAFTGQVESRERGIRNERAFTGEALDSLRQGAIQSFIKRMQAWDVPPEREWTASLKAALLEKGVAR